MNTAHWLNPNFEYQQAATHADSHAFRERQLQRMQEQQERREAEERFEREEA